MKEYHLKYNNYNICIYENGKGEIPIVLLHGAGLDSAMLSWKEVINLLSNNCINLNHINLTANLITSCVKIQYFMPYISLQSNFSFFLGFFNSCAICMISIC